MFRLNHPNVIRLLGICMTETSFIMMEYMENGDLNQVLQHQYYTIVDGGTIPGEGEITQQMLIHICTQIASAMDYPRFQQLCPPWPCHSELSGGREFPCQDFWLWDEPQPLWVTLLHFTGAAPSFQYAGWPRNAFMENSLPRVMCGPLELPCGRYLCCPKRNHTTRCLIRI